MKQNNSNKMSLFIYAMVLVTVAFLTVILLILSPEYADSETFSEPVLDSQGKALTKEQYTELACWHAEDACSGAIHDGRIWNEGFLNQQVLYEDPESYGDNVSLNIETVAMRACRDVLQSYIKEDGWPGPERAKTNLFFWQSRGDLAAQDIVRRWQNDSSLDLRNPSLAKDVLMEYLKLHRLQLEGTVSVLN